LHYHILSLQGLWENLLDEPRRYIQWYNAYDVAFPNVPRELLHLFQFLTAIAIVYLIVRCVRYVRNRRVGKVSNGPVAEPRCYILFITLFAMLFFGAIVHKAGYYNPHLLTWFALCVGILLCDSFDWIAKIRVKWPSAKLVYRALVAAVACAVLAYGYLLFRQNQRYLREVHNQDLAKFAELETALRSIIPDEVCPVAIKAPIMWLAFTEKDYCFATIEHRMSHNVDIRGRDYALIVRPKSPEHWARELDQNQHLIGELNDTAYGNFLVYYTGVDSRYLELKPKRYYFFRRWRGYATGEQLEAAREVFSAEATELKKLSKLPDPSVTLAGLEVNLDPRGDELAELSLIDLKSNTVYKIGLYVSSSAKSELVVLDEATGVWVEQLEIEETDQPQRVEGLFRTFDANRFRIGLRSLDTGAVDPVYVSSIQISEVTPIDGSESAKSFPRAR
jgi:hypothetical protein